MEGQHLGTHCADRGIWQGAAELDRDYRLVDGDGQPLIVQPDGNVVDIDDGSLVLVLIPELVFDVRGEVQSVLSLIPPRGTNQDLRVELIGVTDAEVSTNMVDLRIDAVEAFDRVILTVVSGPRQFVTTTAWSNRSMCGFCCAIWRDCAAAR